MIIAFTEVAWEDYTHWLRTDREKLDRIHLLLKDITRDAFRGIGKPEPLRNNLAGCWSRRIDKEHRLVYKVERKTLFVIQSRYHY
jgi:toxin YoeB